MPQLVPFPLNAPPRNNNDFILYAGPTAKPATKGNRTPNSRPAQHLSPLKLFYNIFFFFSFFSSLPRPVILQAVCRELYPYFMESVCLMCLLVYASCAAAAGAGRWLKMQVIKGTNRTNT